MTMRATRALLVLMCLALIVAVGVPLVSLTMPLWLTRVDLTTASAWLAVGFGLGLYPCAMALERGKHRIWMISGLAVGALAFGLWVQTIFGLPMMDRATWALMVMLATPPTGWAALMSFVASVSILRTVASWVRTVRVLTIITGTLTVTFIVAALTYFPEVQDQWGWRAERQYTEFCLRAGGVLSILSASGLMTVLFASISTRLGRDDVPDSERLALRIDCPRCATSQTIRTDGDACAACGLRIKVTPT